MSSPIAEQEVLINEWRGLYRESWKGVIVDEAFAHPAKFSRALIQQIYDHVIAEGWAKSGDRVIDPFGGVALGAFPAMQHGLVWYGCELEEKFVTLGNQNIALWNERYSRMPNWGEARLAQGDSRKLRDVLRESSCCVTSPPYTNETVNDRNGIDLAKIKKPGGRNSQSRKMQGYGEASGQLGNLAVSSPPYVNSVNAGDHGIDWSKVDPKSTGNRKRGEHSKHGQTLRAHLAYTEDPDSANLGAMVPGDFSAAISSPPFPQPYTGGGGINVKGYSNEAQRKGSSEKPLDLVGKRTYQGKGGDRADGNLETLGLAGFEAAISSPPYEGSVSNPLDDATQNIRKAEESGHTFESMGQPGGQMRYPFKYSGDVDNLGNQRGETFWSASRLILEQLRQVIVPGGHAVFVVKAFVRDKKIVDFPAQWARLCEAVGFRLLHDHHALLTEHYGTQGGFDEDKKLSVERKSFFRRLAESKGSPRIDHENVLCFERT